MEAVVKPRPCPYCGASNHSCHRIQEVAYIVCRKCGAVTSFQGNEKISEALTAYNRRATDEQETRH